jgi:hypothetical protein
MDDTNTAKRCLEKLIEEYEGDEKEDGSQRNRF